MKHLYLIFLSVFITISINAQDKIVLRDGDKTIEGALDLQFNPSTDALEKIIVKDADGNDKEYDAKRVKYVYQNDEKHFILPILGGNSDQYLLKYLSENDNAAILIECNQDGPISNAHIFISKTFKEVIRVETILNMNKTVKKKFGKCKAALKGAESKKYSKKMKGLEALLEDLNQC